jgi:TRAP-type C4-dicarboxylate transport system permease small subunit
VAAVKLAAAALRMAGWETGRMLDPEVAQAWRRWAAAEQRGADEEADLAFRELFRLVPTPLAEAAFRARVRAAVALEAARVEARRRWRRRLLPVVGLAAVGGALYVGLTALVPLVARAAAATIQAAADLVVWVVLAAAHGWDGWTIVARLGRALTTALVSPRVAAGLLVIELVGVAALYGLSRLLRPEKESSPWSVFVDGHAGTSDGSS